MGRGGRSRSGHPRPGRYGYRRDLYLSLIHILSLYEGLSYGCGDAVLGLNPVDDTIDSLTRSLNLFDEIKRELEIPTQICRCV